MVPDLRIAVQNSAPLRPERPYVLYWMIAARRAGWSFALDRALELAERLDRPLLVVEALSASYPWASDRLHRFAIEGMRDNAAAFARGGVRYLPYVETAVGAGRGMVSALGAHACVVVTDLWPLRPLCDWVGRAARALDVRLEAVDSNGLLPLAATERAYPTAHAFRRFLQKALPAHLGAFPRPAPLEGRRRRALAEPPPGFLRRFPPADLEAGVDLGALPIDHGVPPVAGRCGGSAAGRARLETFVADGLDRYGDDRSRPDLDASSGLSPWLHWGHVSAHEVFATVAGREGWAPDDVLVGGAHGRREGWWGMGAAAEAFLDELVTWRELGFVFAHHRPDYDRYESLPDWARATLEVHASDPRPHTYSLEDFEQARTHEPLWNAAQNQLRREGVIHNYLRMLWGKKILHWSPSPRAALAILIELNDRYALDGRDPNSYSGIAWVLGRFDRAWGPERPVFGKVRCMTCASTRRKLRVAEYERRYAG